METIRTREKIKINQTTFPRLLKEYITTLYGEDRWAIENDLIEKLDSLRKSGKPLTKAKVSRRIDSSGFLKDKERRGEYIHWNDMAKDLLSVLQNPKKHFTKETFIDYCNGKDYPPQVTILKFGALAGKMVWNFGYDHHREEYYAEVKGLEHYASSKLDKDKDKAMELYHTLFVKHALANPRSRLKTKIPLSYLEENMVRIAKLRGEVEED